MLLEISTLQEIYIKIMNYLQVEEAEVVELLMMTKID